MDSVREANRRFVLVVQDFESVAIEGRDYLALRFRGSDSRKGRQESEEQNEGP
jgi:hypothetical protein